MPNELAMPKRKKEPIALSSKQREIMGVVWELGEASVFEGATRLPNAVTSREIRFARCWSGCILIATHLSGFTFDIPVLAQQPRFDSHKKKRQAILVR